MVRKFLDEDTRYDEGWSTRNVFLALISAMIILTAIGWGAWMIYMTVFGVQGASK